MENARKFVVLITDLCILLLKECDLIFCLMNLKSCPFLIIQIFFPVCNLTVCCIIHKDPSPEPKTETPLATSYDIIKAVGNFTLFVPCIVIQLLQLKQTKCTLVKI